MKNFWKDGISVEESKVSVLVILTLISAIFGLVMYYLRQDITDNLLSLIQTLIFAIAGVNVANSAKEFFNNKVKNNSNTEFKV